MTTKTKLTPARLLVLRTICEFPHGYGFWPRYRPVVWLLEKQLIKSTSANRGFMVMYDATQAGRKLLAEIDGGVK